MSGGHVPPWGDSSVYASSINLACKKCHRENVEGCYSEYSGTMYYFCRGCGTDYPDQSDSSSSSSSASEEEEEEVIPKNFEKVKMDAKIRGRTTASGASKPVITHLDGDGTVLFIRVDDEHNPEAWLEIRVNLAAAVDGVESPRIAKDTTL